MDLKFGSVNLVMLYGRHNAMSKMYSLFSKEFNNADTLHSVCIMLKKYIAIYSTASRAVCTLPSDLSV